MSSTDQAYNRASPQEIDDLFEDSILEQYGQYGAPIPKDADSLCTLIARTADTAAVELIWRRSSVLNGDISHWAELLGFSELDFADQIILTARQAIFSYLLRETMEGTHGKKPETNTILDDIPQYAAPKKLDQVRDERDQWLNVDQPDVRIGELYEKLMPKESRQQLSHYRSPAAAGELMRSWANRGNGVLLDPGVGSGTLSAPSPTPRSSCPDPKLVVGVDRNPICKLMSMTALSLYNQPHEIIADDFFALSASDLSHDITGAIANPPYTSSRALPDGYVTELQQRVCGENSKLSRNGGLYTYSILHTTKFLDDEGRFGLLVPQAWMNKRYGRYVKRHLLQNYRIEAVIGSAVERIIPQAEITTVILLLTQESKDSARAENTVSFIKLDETLDWFHENYEFGSLLRVVTEESQRDSPAFRCRDCSQDELTEEEPWTRYFTAPEFDMERLESKFSARLCELASVKTGFTSKNNAEYYMTAEELTDKPIEKEHTHPLVRLNKQNPMFLISESDVEYRVVEFDSESIAGSQAEQFILEREGSSVDSIPQRDMKHGRLLRPCGISKRHYTVLNESDACVDKRFICVTPNDESQTKLLFAFLNSSIGTLLTEFYGSQRGGNCLEMSVSTTANLPIIDTREISPSTARSLRTAANELQTEPVRDLTEMLGATHPSDVSVATVNKKIRAIDEIVMGEILGLSLSEQQDVYETVLQVFLNRIKGLC